MTALSRNPDLALLALALPIFAVAGLPLLGWVTAAVIWLAWRGIGDWTQRKANSIDEPGKFAGVMTGSLIARGWMLGIVLFVVGELAGDKTGLSATVLCIVLFTSFFVVRLSSRPSHQAGATS